MAKEELQNLASHGSPCQKRPSLFMVGSQEHNNCRSGLHGHKQQNGIMRQLEIQTLFKGIQYFKTPCIKKRKHTTCLPTFVPQVVVQSRWEIPVSKSHEAPFHVSQWGSTGYLSSVLDCACHLHQKSVQVPIKLLLGGKAPCQATEGTLGPQNKSSSFSVSPDRAQAVTEMK